MNFAYYLHDEKSQEQFEQTLLWFKSRYNLVSINELREHIYNGKPLKNACMLSVDDGWRSTYDVIYPVMKKHNVPFTIFVSPHVMETGMNFWYYTYQFCSQDEIKAELIFRGWYSEEAKSFAADMLLKQLPVDEIYDILNAILAKHPEIEIPRGFMNTNEVLELHRSGLVEVGAHTVMHPVLANETAERVTAEVKGSVERLSDILNKQVESFAYPNGIEELDFGTREMDIVKGCGIKCAFSVNPGVINAKTKAMSIPRWGSMARLKFGRLGMYLPSRANQAKIREEIKKYKLL